MSTEPPPSSASPDSRSPRKTIIRIAKWIIAVAVLVGLIAAGRAAFQQWKTESEKVTQKIAAIDAAIENADAAERRDLQEQREKLVRSIPSWSSVRWSYCFGAGLFYGFGLIPSGFLLHRALRSLHQTPRLPTSIAAQLLGHLGKYVPGKAMVIVLRAGALARDGVRPMPATISIFLETFLMMAVGGAVAGVVVLWLPVPRWIALMSVGVAVLATLPTFPPILRVVAAKLTKFSEDERPAIGRQLFAAGWGWSLLSWLLIGAGFTMLVAAIPSSEPLPPWHELYLVSTAAISLAMVIGFGSLLPGGAGVRELVVTTVLGVALGPIHGILCAIAARILFILVESLLAGSAWLWLKSQHRVVEDLEPAAKTAQP